MKYSLVAFAFLFASLSAASHGHAELIRLNDITTPIVPTSNRTGDRDFFGHGPRIIVVVRLSIERGGRAIFARVAFSAREIGGDGSATFIQPRPFLVWRRRPADGARFVHAINEPTVSTLNYTSPPACCGCAVITRPGGVRLRYEDGGAIVPVRVNNGPVREITILGDTCGDDISTDKNPRGDTSIRRIRFNRINVTFGRTLLRRVPTRRVYERVKTSSRLPAVRCRVGRHVSAILCSGSFCDNIEINCGNRAMHASRRFHTAWVEDAGRKRAECAQYGPTADYHPPDPRTGVMVGIACSGDNCDNIRLECVNLRDLRPDLYGACTTIDKFSEERGRNSVRIPINHGIVSIECSGRHCDDKKVMYCPLVRR